MNTREEKGYSMNQLAQKSGLVVQAVSFVEKRQRKPNIETLARLAFGLGTTPSHLLQLAEQRCKQDI